MRAPIEIETGIAAKKAAPTDVSSALVQFLEELRVCGAFGLTGGALAKIFDALGRAEFPVLHCRHEGGAAFAATEASLASGRPAVVFTTTGPGVTNALTGLLAAKGEGAKVLLISAATPAPVRGRGACQESTPQTLPSDLYQRGAVFDYAVTIEHPAQLATAAARLSLGFGRPGPFVAHLALPTSVQGMALGSPLRVTASPYFSGPSFGGLQAAAERLTSAPFVIWAGFGAREAAHLVRELAERTGAPVICSPRGKGVMPERHPLYLGTTGLGGHASVNTYFKQRRPAHLLVLGTRLGEPTSYWETELLPTDAIIQVDLDPQAHASGYPSTPTLAIQSDIAEFLRALLWRMPANRIHPIHTSLGPEAPPLLKPQEEGPVRAAALIAAVQRIVVDGSDAIVMTESGNAFAWGNHLLRFESVGRYRVSVGFGSMGHVTTGVIGAAVATGRKAVAIVGDGSMLMNSEVSTAVAHELPAVWIVMNDGGYGMVKHGMDALGFEPPDMRMPETDFALLAKGMGAQGERVQRETELDAALNRAMEAHGPYVIDVRTDPAEAGPWIKRIQALIAQGAEARGGGR